MTTLGLSGLGCVTPVEIGSIDPHVSDELRRAWSRCLGNEPSGTVSEAVTFGDGDLSTRDSADRLLQRLTQDVTRAKIRAQAGQLLLVHAGALCNPSTGDAVAFAAPGGTGKTTLMRTLGRRHAYLTDETVAVRADRSILPYPKPLSLRQHDGQPKRETSPDELGLLPTPSSARLRRIVLLDRSRSHVGVPHVEELSLHSLLNGLAPETSSLSQLPRPLHWVSDLVGTLDPPVRLTYLEADDIVELVDDWLQA